MSLLIPYPLISKPYLCVPLLVSQPYLCVPLLVSQPYMYVPLLVSQPYMYVPLLVSHPYMYVPLLVSQPYLCAFPVQYKGLHIVCVTFQLHQFLTRSWVPNPDNLLRGAGHDDSAWLVHGEAVDGVFVAVEGRRWTTNMELFSDKIKSWCYLYLPRYVSHISVYYFLLCQRIFYVEKKNTSCDEQTWYVMWYNLTWECPLLLITSNCFWLLPVQSYNTIWGRFFLVMEQSIL